MTAHQLRALPNLQEVADAWHAYQSPAHMAKLSGLPVRTFYGERPAALLPDVFRPRLSSPLPAAQQALARDLLRRWSGRQPLEVIPGQLLVVDTRREYAALAVLLHKLRHLPELSDMRGQHRKHGNTEQRSNTVVNGGKRRTIRDMAARGCTLREIGCEVGVTRERVRQLIDKHGYARPLDVRKPEVERRQALRAARKHEASELAQARQARRRAEWWDELQRRDALWRTGQQVADIAWALGLNTGSLSQYIVRMRKKHPGVFALRNKRKDTKE